MSYGCEEKCVCSGSSYHSGWRPMFVMLEQSNANTFAASSHSTGSGWGDGIWDLGLKKNLHFPSHAYSIDLRWQHRRTILRRVPIPQSLWIWDLGSVVESSWFKQSEVDDIP